VGGLSVCLSVCRRVYKHVTLLPEERKTDLWLHAGNMNRKFREVWTCGFSAYASGQTDRHTDRLIAILHTLPIGEETTLFVRVVSDTRKSAIG